MALLELYNISYIKENKSILDNISLKIDRGEFISLVGTSGSGKSTLFKICSHLISQTGGEIYFKGKSFKEYNPVELRKNICYCFQTPYLFGKDVMENLKFPYSLRKQKVDIQRVKELFSVFNLKESILYDEIKNLSGGEKQRICLIRSILFKPEILLLDEITSALDKENVYLVENSIKYLNDEGMTIMWITHNEEQSRKYSDKRIIISNGQINNVEVLK